LLDHRSHHTPDIIVVTADATNLKRGLLLLTQIIDIGLPTVLALNMMDLVAKAGISYDIKKLSHRLGVPVVPINARNGIGIDELKKQISQPAPPLPGNRFSLYGMMQRRLSKNCARESVSTTIMKPINFWSNPSH
jgi:ferrous iron transport protein B